MASDHIPTGKFTCSSVCRPCPRSLYSFCASEISNTSLLILLSADYLALIEKIEQANNRKGSTSPTTTHLQLWAWVYVPIHFYSLYPQGNCGLSVWDPPLREPDPLKEFFSQQFSFSFPHHHIFSFHFTTCSNFQICFKKFLLFLFSLKLLPYFSILLYQNQQTNRLKELPELTNSNSSRSILSNLDWRVHCTLHHTTATAVVRVTGDSISLYLCQAGNIFLLPSRMLLLVSFSLVGYSLSTAPVFHLLDFSTSVFPHCWTGRGIETLDDNGQSTGKTTWMSRTCLHIISH